MKIQRKFGFRGERRGASQVLLITAQIPLLVLVIATMVEVSGMLSTQMGLRYSAVATARAAAVWLPAEGSVEQRLSQIQMAANSSLAPWATGRQPHVQHISMTREDQHAADSFHEALTSLQQVEINNDLLRNKITYARHAMRIEIDVFDRADPLTGLRRLESANQRVVVNYVGRRRNRVGQRTNPDMEVRVFYEKPIDLPGVGRFLGQLSQIPGAQFYSRTMASKCEFTLEGVRSENYRMGVNYDVFKDLK